MSNSNFNITKVTVDPTSQEITNLEINGKAFESGSEPNLEEVTDTINENGTFLIEPSEGYDGISSLDLTVDVGLVPYTLKSVLLTQCDFDGEAVEDPDYYKGIATGDMIRPEWHMTNFWSFGKWNSAGEEGVSNSGVFKSFTYQDKGEKFVYQIENDDSYYTLSFRDI